MFSEMGEIEIFNRVGLTPVFFSRTLVGPRMPNLVYMLVYDDMAAREKNWAAFRNDPEWKKLSATPGFTDPGNRLQHHVHLSAPCGVSRNPMRILHSLTSHAVVSPPSRLGWRRSPSPVYALGRPPGRRPAGIHRHLHRREDEQQGHLRVSLRRGDRRADAARAEGGDAEPKLPGGQPRGKVFYAVNEMDDYKGAKAGSVTVVHGGREDGRLTPLGDESTGGSDPCHVQCDRTGKVVAVANYSGGNFAVCPVGPVASPAPPPRCSAAPARDPTSAPAGPARAPGGLRSDQPLPARSGPRARQDPGLRVRPGERQRDTQRPGVRGPAPGSGPRHLAFHPNGGSCSRSTSSPRR